MLIFNVRIPIVASHSTVVCSSTPKNKLCELRRVDMLHEVSLMSAYMAQPREKHLEIKYSMLGYLKEHPECMMSYGPSGARY